MFRRAFRQDAQQFGKADFRREVASALAIQLSMTVPAELAMRAAPSVFILLWERGVAMVWEGGALVSS